MKNKIAVRLTLYFAGVLVVFALLLGAVFHQVSKKDIVATKEREMLLRAHKIAELLGDNTDMTEKHFGGSGASGKFIRYLDKVSQETVWVVDGSRSLNMDVKERHKHKRGERAENAGHIVPKDPKEAYAKLPPHVKEKVEEGFKGKEFAVEEYNSFLEGIMLTVGVPVSDDKGQVKAVVLLHSPVAGLQEAARSALRILGISLVAGLLLAFALSVILSWRFTEPLGKMKKIAERLAERDYSARNNIVQEDEIGELAQTLDVLAERLEVADKESRQLESMRKEFIANISHELRTPVTVIRGSLEALKDGVVADKAQVEEFYEQMHRESLFLQRLINDLLELSRLQNADFPMDKELLNFYDVLQNAIRSGRQLAAAKNIGITTDYSGIEYMLRGDYVRLRQMLLIFLDNAVKFSADGAEIEISFDGDKLVIKDHGCGMESEEALHACDRFYKTRNEQNKNGSGLGLAIAKQIAERHGIALAISSAPGVGTNVALTLPAAVKEEAE